ncbi:MAG: NAD+ synthase [Candidatus Heimdallarchaeota archaeon]
MQIFEETLKLPPAKMDWILARCELFIRERVSRAGAAGAIIGLSGGIDSSTAAVICMRALGSDKVLVILLPERTNNPEDREHALLVVNQFNIPYEELEITEIIDQVRSVVTKLNEKDKRVFGNIKARIRMLVLYAIANLKNYLVVGSSNKSELLTGYYTKYGDGGADILPLGDLYKTQMRQLATHLRIPQVIIDKPPSAGLWPGQTDEEELGIRYKLLDKILWGLEHWMDPKKIAAQLEIPLETVLHVQKLIQTSEHKRRGPILLKIGYRTPGLDWRIPV